MSVRERKPTRHVCIIQPVVSGAGFQAGVFGVFRNLRLWQICVQCRDVVGKRKVKIENTIHQHLWVKSRRSDHVSPVKLTLASEEGSVRLAALAHIPARPQNNPS